MTAILCSIWPYLFGALLGWLAAGLMAKLLRQPPPVIERIVEKTVERTVADPGQLERIRRLESEVAAIPGLRNQVQQLQSAPPKTIEKIVDRIVEVQIPDLQALDEKDRVIEALRATLAERDAQLASGVRP